MQETLHYEKLWEMHGMLVLGSWPELGKAIQGYYHCWSRSVLFRGYGGESTSSAMECSKFEEVLLLAIGNVLIWVVYNLLCK